MRSKHRNDKNHVREGWHGASPRYSGRRPGTTNFKGDKARDKQVLRRQLSAAS